jgi:hypothetical protein
LLFSPSPHHFKTKNFRTTPKKKKGLISSQGGRCFRVGTRHKEKPKTFESIRNKKVFSKLDVLNRGQYGQKSSKGGIGWEDNIEGGIEGGSLSPLVFYF